MPRFPVKRLLSPMLAQAKELAKDPQRVEHLLIQARALVRSRGDAMVKIKAEVFGLFRFLKSSITRDYKEATWSSILLALAGVIYLVSPLDFIPDILPGGLIDDFAVLAYVLKTLRGELIRFHEWEIREGRTLDVPARPAKSAEES